MGLQDRRLVEVANVRKTAWNMMWQSGCLGIFMSETSGIAKKKADFADF
jgi:hypothetical protein